MGINMDNLIGIRTKNFTLIASDMGVNRSVLQYKSDEDKFSNINNQVVFGHCGNFSKGCDLRVLITENFEYFALSDLVPVNSFTVSNYIQNLVHYYLRRNPHETALMVMDVNNELYAIDQYGARFQSNYICLGVSSYFLYGLLDNEYNENMSLDQAVQLLQKCIDCLKERVVYNYPKFKVKIFDKGELKSLEISIQAN